MEHQINGQSQKRNCLCHNVLKTHNIQNKEGTLRAEKKSQITPQRQACQNVADLSVQILIARGACNDAFQTLTEDSASPVQY